MRQTQRNRKDAYYILLLTLLLLLPATVACIPLAAQPPDVAQPLEATEQLQTITRELRSAIVLDSNGEMPVTQTASTSAAAAAQVDLQETLTHLYRQANPSVVYILVTSGGPLSTLSGRGSGSGFIYSEEGYIVTNNHVVDSGAQYEIVFFNGDRQRAQLLGADPDSDLAVLQVDALPTGVAALPLADGSAIEVGQFAVAIGNPFGEQGSMSLGIISGLGRSLPSQRTTGVGSTYSLPQVIQTDAPINPGNSGGPLLNLSGEVIGVNAAIATATGTNSGVGFSIPVDVVRRVVPSLLETGEFRYPYMGLTFAGEITLDAQEVYGLSQTQGAYILNVMPGSPAEQAGLIAANAQTGQGGDLVIEIDSQPIRDFSDLNTYLVLEAEVGQTIEMTVLRSDTILTLPLTLGMRP